MSRNTESDIIEAAQKEAFEQYILYLERRKIRDEKFTFVMEKQKLILNYIKMNNLQDPKDGRRIICDDYLINLGLSPISNVVEIQRTIAKLFPIRMSVKFPEIVPTALAQPVGFLEIVPD
jgi:hypothetical protein